MGRGLSGMDTVRLLGRPSQELCMLSGPQPLPGRVQLPRLRAQVHMPELVLQQDFLLPGG